MLKASRVQDRAEQSPDKKPLERFLPLLLNLGPPSPGDADFPGTSASPVSHTNTHMPLRHMPEDIKTNWLRECWASEKKKRPGKY